MAFYISSIRTHKPLIMPKHERLESRKYLMENQNSGPYEFKNTVLVEFLFYITIIAVQHYALNQIDNDNIAFARQSTNYRKKCEVIDKLQKP